MTGSARDRERPDGTARDRYGLCAGAYLGNDEDALTLCVDAAQDLLRNQRMPPAIDGITRRLLAESPAGTK